MGNKTKGSKQTPNNRNQIIILVLALIILGLSATIFLPRLLGDSGDSGLELAKNKRISVEEAYQLYQNDVFVLDVRTPEEWITGHIPGATLIPLDELAVRFGELPVGEPILIYCRSGNRSLEAMNLLDSVGFMNLSSMDGGIKDWMIAGYPLE